MGDQDNLHCWPSDSDTITIRKKHDIVAFYRQILWASQLCEMQQNTLERNDKRCKVVSFSSEPPTIYEYEPEYSKSKLGIFDYQIFRRRFQQHQLHQKDEHRQFISSKLEEKSLEVKKMVADDNEYKNHKLMKTRSISEFRPLRNMKYSNLNNSSSKDGNTPTLPYSFPINTLDSVHVPLEQIDIFRTNDNFTLSTQNRTTANTPYTYQQQHSSSSLSFDENDPPPTYIEYSVTNDSGNEKRENQFVDTKVNSINNSTRNTERERGNSGKNDDVESTNAAKNQDSKGQAFFHRTLRKIKSSPKLIEIQRRSSSLRKKKSFSMSTSA